MDLTKYHYLFNATAYFETQEKYPDGTSEALWTNNKDTVKNLCWFLQLLSEQGELMRRAMGYDKEETFKADEAIPLFMPRDVLIARSIIEAAITNGMKNTEDEEEEVDVVLVELKKKKKA